eukprot:TRINITY_DN47962_c0_g1_i1.p3 TRINITY_DN47962_c0_g1~~TRINITY_DN47962_c0_g1_i1.p3  ORF type:complete len:108 (+),score=34.94 TRINITY_DN47962_c0_g1_i1:71-394(+)
MPKGKAKGPGKAKESGAGKKGKPTRGVKKQAPGKISKGGIRRLARRGGVKRLASAVYDTVRTAVTQFVDHIMRDTATIMELTGQKTVTTADILYALRKNGRTLYVAS